MRPGMPSNRDGPAATMEQGISRSARNAPGSYPERERTEDYAATTLYHRVLCRMLLRPSVENPLGQRVVVDECAELPLTWGRATPYRVWPEKPKSSSCDKPNVPTLTAKHHLPVRLLAGHRKDRDSRPAIAVQRGAAHVHQLTQVHPSIHSLRLASLYADGQGRSGTIVAAGVASRPGLPRISD